MPVFKLSDNSTFPPHESAEPDGLLAYGGDLSTPRLLSAYAQGIFPWYTEGDPYLWWSPDPRMVLFPDKFKRPKSLRLLVQSQKLTVTVDQTFEQVIQHCAFVARNLQSEGTWITDEMMEAYIRLHQLGYAHSVEVWQQKKLVGGLYGISLGGVFFGESMFHLVSNASKVALWHLVDRMLEWKFDLIDAQQDTNHLRNMGGEVIGRKLFLHLLNHSLKKPSKIGKWI